MWWKIFPVRNYITGCNFLSIEVIGSVGRALELNYGKQRNTWSRCLQYIREFHVSGANRKSEGRREMLASLPTRDEGTEGEKGVNIDFAVKSREDMFPDENTPTRMFNGIPFRDIPICNIKATKNNTIISVTDAKGVVKLLRTAGIEGFKNTRKGTNIAGQATAISLSTKAIEQGFKTVRVRVQGLGPGRMSAIKGLQMGGLDIISVTDSTRISWHPPRPRKRRKL